MESIVSVERNLEKVNETLSFNLIAMLDELNDYAMSVCYKRYGLFLHHDDFMNEVIKNVIPYLNEYGHKRNDLLLERAIEEINDARGNDTEGNGLPSHPENITEMVIIMKRYF